MRASALALPLAAASVALLASTSAFALEGKALFDKIVAASSDTVTVGSVEEIDGDSVVARDVKIVSERGTTATYETVTMDGLVEDGDRVRVAQSVSTNGVVDIVGDGERSGNAKLRLATTTSRDVIAPAGAIFAVGQMRMEGRAQVGSYTIDGAEADFNDDGTFETTMAQVVLTDLDTPLDFRFTPEQIEAATGPAPEPFTLGNLQVTGTKVDVNGVVTTLADLSLKDVKFPASANADPLDFVRTYTAFTAGPLEVKRGDTRLFAIDAMKADIADREGKIEQSSSVEGIVLALGELVAPQQKAVIEQLGYGTLSGRSTAAASYDPTTGRAATDDFTVTFDDVGALKLGLAITGYTPEIARKLNELQVQQAQSGGQPNPMAFMDLLKDVKVESFELSFTDDSVTRKMLELAAQRQPGQSADQLASGVPMLIAIGMGGLGTPQLTQEVAGAVGSFLQNPGTLAVRVEPMQPAPVSEIIGLAQQPQQLVDRLGVKVEATQ